MTFAESADAPAPGAAARPATAVPADHELGGLAAYASPPVRGGTNPFGLGFGARLGLVASGVYLGVRLVSFQGGADVDASEHALTVGADVGYGLRARVGAETWLTLRPELGAGAVVVTRVDPPQTKAVGTTGTHVASLPPRVTMPDVVTQATSTVSSSGASRGSVVSNPNETNVASLYLRPGVTALLASSPFFVAVGGGVLVVPAMSYDGTRATWLSYAADGQLGVCW